MRNAYKILDGEPEGRRLLNIPRNKWGDIRMDFQETGWCQWQALVNKVTKLWVKKKKKKAGNLSS
jgi:hypothetical protein